MQGIELTGAGLLELADAFFLYFFPYVMATVVALAPWVVALGSAFLCYRFLVVWLPKWAKGSDNGGYWVSQSGNEIYGVERRGRSGGRNQYWVPYANRHEFDDEMRSS